MAKKKSSGLGRGLGEIFDEISDAYENELPTNKNSIEEIAVVEIELNPYQPRKVFDEAALKELSASIKRHGLLQPIVVVKELDGYILIAGERRLRASKMAKHTHIKAVVLDTEISKLHELALIENIQRENLNPIELAKSYDLLLKEHNITHDELSTRVHKSRTQITNTLRLLQLCDVTQTALLDGKISQGHAKVLVGLDTDEQERLTNSIIGQKLSVREVEQMAKGLKHSKEPTKVEKPEHTSLETTALTTFLKSHDIPLKVGSKGLTIELTSQEDIDKFSKILSL